MEKVYGLERRQYWKIKTNLAEKILVFLLGPKLIRLPTYIRNNRTIFAVTACKVQSRNFRDCHTRAKFGWRLRPIRRMWHLTGFPYNPHSIHSILTTPLSPFTHTHSRAVISTELGCAHTRIAVYSRAYIPRGTTTNAARDARETAAGPLSYNGEPSPPQTTLSTPRVYVRIHTHTNNNDEDPRDPSDGVPPRDRLWRRRQRRRRFVLLQLLLQKLYIYI